MPSKPAIPALLEADLATVCAQFLVAVAETDGRNAAPAQPFLSSLMATAEEILKAANSDLEKESFTASQDPAAVALGYRLTGHCLLLKARVQLRERNLSLANQTAHAIMTLVHGVPSARLHPLVAGVLTNLWLGARHLLCDIFGRLGRFADVTELSSRAVMEASSSCSGVWIRKFVMQRALAEFQLGDKEGASQDCEQLIAHFERIHLEDLILIRAMMLKGSIIRQALLNVPGTVFASSIESRLELQRRARTVATNVAKSYGFVGIDSNITFHRDNSMVMAHVAQPPLLYDISSCHSNFPPLSTRNMSYESLVGGGSGADSLARKQTMEFKAALRDPSDYRGGFFDKEQPTIASEFGNIYLESVRVLVVVLAALASTINDVRCAGSLKANDELFVCCEDGLKALRHVVYAPAFAQLLLLTYAGKARIAAGVLTGEEMLSPLLSALELAFSSCHSWEHMRTICLELVAAYGGNAVKLADGEHRLRLATNYLQAAVKLTNQRALVANDVLGFCKSLTGPCVDDVAAIMGKVVSGSQGQDATGRDALFFLSSILRAADCMWADGFEADLLWDLQTALRKCYPVYASQCCLGALPTAAAPAVAHNAIFTVWDASAAGLIAGSKDAGGFPFLTGYFLLGPVATVVVAVDAKGKPAPKGSDASAPSSTKVQEPVLKRISLPRSDVHRLGQRGAHFKTQLQSKLSTAAGSDDAVKTLAQPFSVYIAEIVQLLRCSVGVDAADKAVAVDASPEGTRVTSPSGACLVPLSVATAEHLAAIFAPTSGCDAMPDAPLCALLRLAFGYEIDS